MNNEEHVYPIFQILPKYVEIKSCKHEPLSTFSLGHESNIKTIKQIKTNTNHPYPNRNPKFPKSIILSNCNQFTSIERRKIVNMQGET